MGLGSTTKKLQMMADKAEQLYAQLNEVKRQLEDLRAKVDTTHDTVSDLEIRHEQNRALLEALAEQQGIDVERVLTEASIEDVEEPGPAPDGVGSEDVPGEPGEPGEPAETADDAEGVGTETS
ncbi:DUF5798 family protein [Halalkalicoccus sp. NIPERK01]|uniref:DUF5798 family protein n=1 Tax=Halalkalicoccus sp. NIPERK01 TaxID=3053469 RepID=UPI00256EB011|nr:DUF5798 family protein [Halalkalicoccus sp. NIPERK01]MDL5360378.1 DUF5798 family protein [Halalkalicoccus sp. NIPERK01]